METMLVPLDGSERSEQALPYAVLLGRLFDASICLLHVVTDRERHEFEVRRDRMRATYLPYGPDKSDPTAALRRRDEEYLLARVRELHAAGFTARAEVAFGSPAEAIVAAAARLDDGVVVMSTHGRGSLGLLLAGSTAHDVIRLAPCPVLAVHGPAPASPQLREIVVPLDGSDLAREALPPAIGLARRAGATLTLLMVALPAEERPDAIREELLIELNRVMTVAPDVTVVTAIGEGPAATTICREAERRGADLIVMTAHGEGGRRPSGIGGVTDRALHVTHVPILVIRPHGTGLASGEAAATDTSRV